MRRKINTINTTGVLLCWRQTSREISLKKQFVFGYIHLHSAIYVLSQTTPKAFNSPSLSRGINHKVMVSAEVKVIPRDLRDDRAHLRGDPLLPAAQVVIKRDSRGGEALRDRSDGSTSDV